MRRGQGIAAAAVTAFALLLVLWGTGSGTPLVEAPTGLVGSPASRTTPTVTRPNDVVTQTLASLAPTNGKDVPVDWLVILTCIALFGLLVAVLRYLLSRVWGADEKIVDEDDSDLELENLVAATSAARLLELSEGDPRNAVVASWVSLEDAVARGGLRRDPSETSAELTQRVLGRWDVDQETVATMAGLYREARFSQHPISEQMRDQALAAMSRVHAQLKRRLDAEAAAAREAREAAAREALARAEAGDPGGASASPQESSAGAASPWRRRTTRQERDR